MTLTDFMIKEKITRDEFARRIGVDANTVYRWEVGLRYPQRHIRKIMAITKGKVTANDFVGDAA